MRIGGILPARLREPSPTAAQLADEHVAQFLGSLRTSRVELGPLINLGALKLEMKRYALSRIDEVSRPGGHIGGVLLLVLLELPGDLSLACLRERWGIKRSF